MREESAEHGHKAYQRCIQRPVLIMISATADVGVKLESVVSIAELSQQNSNFMMHLARMRRQI